MFHFPAYPPETRFRCQPMTTGGLPHSDTLGSKPCRRLPQDYRGPTRPSSVLSAKASTIRPSRQPQQIIMTKALLKNPRTTSDHETHHNGVLPKRYERTQGPHGPSDSNHSTNTNPTHNRRADARVHYPVLKPPPHQDTHPHQQAPGNRPGGQPATTPPHGGRWRPGNPTARTTPQTNHDSSTPARQGGDDKPSHLANPSPTTVHKTMHAQISVERR